MTKGELMSVRRQWVRIIQQEEYLTGLRGLLDSMERSLRQGRTNTTSKQVETLALKIVAAEEKLQREYRRLEEMEDALRTRISEQIAEPTLQRMLILRYVKRQTWTQIAKALDKSRRQIYRMHEKFASQLDAHRSG